MTNCNETRYKLQKITQFNRFFAVLVFFNLYLYTNNLTFIENNITTISLIVLSWVTTFAYLVTNELIIKNIKKNIVCTIDECFSITKLNAILSSVLITTIILCTGNINFSMLFLIPIINCLFFSGSKISYIIAAFSVLLYAFTDITNWNQIENLIMNQSTNIPLSLTNGSMIILLCTLGMIHSSYSKYQKEKSNKFHTMATTDALTGIPNRMEFNKNILKEFSRAKRHKNKLTVAMFDIDFFKKINDNYGHTSGDIILQEIGDILKKQTRDCDVVARYGGEEFALIFPDTTQQSAIDVLERLREKIEKHTFKANRKKIDVTISLGVAEYRSIDKNAEDFINRVDSALYKAKRNGRNRLESATLSDGNVSISYDLKAINQ